MPSPSGYSGGGRYPFGCLLGFDSGGFQKARLRTLRATCNEAYSTPINHCGREYRLKVRIRAHPPPSDPALCSQQAGVVWCGIDPPQRATPPERSMIARRRCVSELDPKNPQQGYVSVGARHRAGKEEAARARHRTASRATAGSRPAPVPSRRL